MAWSNKDFDPQVLSEAAVGAVQQAFSRSNLPHQVPDIKAVDIVEYDGRMRAMGLERLDSPCYVSAVNFYLSKADMDRRNKPKGAMVLYMETETAGKLFKAAEIPFADDEDDASMTTACGQFAQMVADALNSELSAKGYAALVPSKPQNYKNSVMGGVEFSPDQKTKHEITFVYFKHKAIGVDLTLAPIPKK